MSRKSKACGVSFQTLVHVIVSLSLNQSLSFLFVDLFGVCRSHIKALDFTATSPHVSLHECTMLDNSFLSLLFLLRSLKKEKKRIQNRERES